VADTLPTGDEPQEELEDPEALAAGLDLGLDLSPEDQAEVEQMVAHLREQFGLDEEPGVPESEPEEPDNDPFVAEEPEPDPTPAPVVSTPTQVPPSTRGVVVIDGVEVPVEEAVKVLLAREQAKPKAEPQKPPEWLDTDDAAQVAMWGELQSLKAGQQQVAQNQQQIAQQQAVARATQDAEAGIGTFRTLHPELSEEDLTKLRLHAVSLDIIDGLAKNRSGQDAVLKALDIAYWDHPEYRARAVAAPTPAETKKKVAAERKGKLNALGGSSGSAPRQESQPDLSTDNAAKKAAAEWLKAQNIL
jgi:hypothetical protein